jgi:sulfonate transport system substrate-binding protein
LGPFSSGILVDGKNLVANRGFFFSTRSFVDQNPQLIDTLLTELKQTSAWAKQNPSQVAAFLSNELGIDKAALEYAEKRRQYGVEAITAQVTADQQKIADTFQKLNLIPKSIQVADAVWQAKS